MLKLAKSFNSVVKNNLLLLLFVICLFFLNYYSKTLFFRPNSIHQWRQADCLSITKNYYEEGMHFFEPKIHYQGPKGGKAVSEFPILNYTVAFLWKIFGEHEFIYRLLEYLLFLTAIFVAFNTILRFYRSALLAFFTVSIFLTSPLLTYYSVSFIADVPALSLGMIGFCCFMRYYYTKEKRFFYIACVLGVLAVLIKASALMGFVMLLFFSLIDIFKLNKQFRTEPLFTKKLYTFLLLFASVILIIGWYRHALNYNNNNKNLIFLLTVLPIWEMDRGELIYNLRMLFNSLFPLFLNKGMFFLFITLLVFVITKFKSLDSFLKYSFLFSTLFFVVYILFFFQVFGVHDYYLNNLMIFPFITLLCFAHIVSNSNFISNNLAFVRLFLVIIIVFNSIHSAAVYRLRTLAKDNLIEWFPFISEEEMKMAEYLAWAYGSDIKRIEELTPDLRKHGIKREDFVLSIPDPSFDISLYFMDQKGYTIARDHIMNDTTVADRFLTRGVKYLVLSDTSLKEQIAFKRIENHLEPLFIKNKVKVYKFKTAR